MICLVPIMEGTKMSKKGFFIVFEGIDGSGTTTQADKVSEYFNSKKIAVHITREPTNYLIGGLIRSWLTGDWSSSPECLQLLFTADRAHHLEKEIIPLLKKGKNVITDRYYFSTIAYGSMGIPDGHQWLIDINRRFLEPDLVIYLRVSAEEAMNRIEASRHTELELFERKDKLARVIAAYDSLAEDIDYFVVIDGEQSKEKVTQDILNAFKDKLNLG